MNERQRPLFPTDQQIAAKLFQSGTLGLAAEAREKLLMAANAISPAPRSLQEAEHALAQARRWLDGLHKANEEWDAAKD